MLIGTATRREKHTVGAASPDRNAGSRALDQAALRELQRQELLILLDVQAVCGELGIEFFLGEGTLLGAIRHQGFIPWDDDIDLLMRRSEYRRFLRLAPPLLAPKYTVQHASTVEDYWSPVLKVRLVEGDPIFRQEHIGHLTSDNGPLIDVFPIDYVPKPTGLGIWLQSTYIRLLRSLLVHKLRTKPANNLPRKLLRGAARGVSTRALHRQLEWAHTLHGARAHPYLATLATYHPVSRQVVPASAFAAQVPILFEGHELPAPAGHDLVLSTTYGDYRTLPPESERGSSHDFVIRADAPA